MRYGSIEIRFCQPCTVSTYKLQNLVLAKRRSSQNHRKMYLQIIVHCKVVLTDYYFQFQAMVVDLHVINQLLKEILASPHEEEKR